jgi:hypothetical protein
VTRGDGCASLSTVAKISSNVGAVSTSWGLSERLLRVDHVRYVWSRTISGPSVGCVWRVGQVSPIGCTSI